MEKKYKYQVPAKRMNIIHKVYNLNEEQIDGEIILVETWHGKTASGEPFEFVKDLVNKCDNYKIHVVAENNLSAINISDHGFEPVIFGTEKYYRLQKIAKYKFISANLVDGIPKNKDQIVVQMWHGFPTKKMISDLEDKNEATIQYRETYKRIEVWDYVTICSEWYDRLISSSFRLEEHNEVRKIKVLPYRINNLLVSKNNECEINRLKSKYIINTLNHNMKVVLISPTWRSYSQPETIFNMTMLLNKLPGYIFIIKLHPKDSASMHLYKNIDERIICFYNEMVDINELYLISDCMISDYSSAIFDYMVLNKPVFIHIPDHDTYTSQIGLYFDLRDECDNIEMGNYSENEIALLIKKYESIDVNFDKFTNKILKEFSYVNPVSFLKSLEEKNEH